MTDLNAFLPYVNAPLVGRAFRRALWIEEMHAPVVNITPNAYHVSLGDDRYRAVLRASNHYSEAAHKNLGWLMRQAHNFDMQVANRFAPAFNLGFDTYTSQPDESDGVDTYLRKSTPNTNYGTVYFLGIGEANDALDDVHRSLIKFDLSSVRPNSTVNSASLYLNLFQAKATHLRIYRIYECLVDWVESQATWNIYSTGNNWTTAGAGSDGNDYDSTDLGNWNASGDASGGIKTFAFTNDGLAYLQRKCGGTANLLLRADTEIDDLLLFSSSVAVTSSDRPKLEFDYTAFAGGCVFWM